MGERNLAAIFVGPILDAVKVGVCLKEKILFSRWVVCFFLSEFQLLMKAEAVFSFNVSFSLSVFFNFRFLVI